MPELLLELFSEEIPARMQARAAADLANALNKALLDAGFMPEEVKAFATPRRLTVVAAGLPARQPDRREEKKGPRIGAPEKAVEGFLKSAGLSSLDRCERREDKKGAYWVAVIDQKGRETADIIAETVPDIMRGFSWPKSMRWSDRDMRWVRPLHSALCVFGGKIVDFEIDGIKSGDKTFGHRFLAPGEIRARSFDDYAKKLRAAKVILDAAERKEMIAGDAATLCKAQGLELVEDAGLLNEVAGLAEWPVAMIGSFDEKFLTLPDEVLTASMRGHQKYFSVRDPKTGRLANRFVFVANLEAPDGGAAMREGYERVLAARLSDAWFLYHQDLKTPLENRIKNLDKVTFFEGLGSVGDKARRIAALAKEIAPAVGADPETAARAAMLAKADLVTSMVYEFPELQGVMGRYYYLAQSASPLSRRAGEGNKNAIADAIRDHYKPAGQDDDVPTAPVSIAVALADKIDTLVLFFWAIDLPPTGSSDPYALRRAALGFIKTIINNQLRFTLRKIFNIAASEYYIHRDFHLFTPEAQEKLRTLAYPRERYDFLKSVGAPYITWNNALPHWANFETDSFAPPQSIVAFFHDRLKVYLRDKGHRYDAIDAVLTDADGNLQDDLVLIVKKLEALEAFLKTDDGENLAAAYKRAANILKAEEKTDGAPADPNAVDKNRLKEREEKALFAALEKAETKAEKGVKNEDFESAMAALAFLRKPLDAFFDHVTVNAEDKNLRANRLALLARFRAATAKVADFSKLEG